MFASRSYQARGDSSNCCIVLARNSLSVMWATTSSFGPPQPSRRRLLDIWFLSGERTEDWFYFFLATRARLLLADCALPLSATSSHSANFSHVTPRARAIL